MGIINALNKLNEKQMNYCKTLSVLIERDRKKDNGFYPMEIAKLRGYLECLSDMGIISQFEIKLLFLWFNEKDRT